jgi:hypothetical protein
MNRRQFLKGLAVAPLAAAVPIAAAGSPWDAAIIEALDVGAMEEAMLLAGQRAANPPLLVGDIIYLDDRPHTVIAVND